MRSHRALGDYQHDRGDHSKRRRPPPANVVANGRARQWSREPEKFGTGTYEGLVATDVSNSAVVPGALISTLTLGIPGSGTTVIMMAA